MRLKAFLQRAFAGVKASVRQAIADANKPVQRPGFHNWGVMPDVADAFAAAVAKRERPAHKVASRKRWPSTSRGRHWFPRLAHCIVLRNKETGIERVMPEKGYWMDAKGTIRKVRPAC